MNPDPMDRLVAPDWGFGAIATLTETREIAQQHAIPLLVSLRDYIGIPVADWQADQMSDVTLEELHRLQTEPRSDETIDILLRSFKLIALDPVRRADMLLALDAHIAYLRAAFDIPEPEAEA